MDITSLKGWEMKERLLGKEISSREILSAHLDMIDRKEKDLNAFITLDREGAIEAARKVDAKLQRGEDLGALAGIPVALKDNILTKNLRTTCGSRMLENFNPPYDATVVRKIREADGVILGKTNMDEFAMGGSTETSYFGNTRNPRDLSRVPGGSSGGSAAAVAGHETPLALGSDTGGSVRQPASFCGIVGMKPTYGLVSRYGVVPMSNSLDQIGVFGRDVKDAHMMLTSVSGYDPLDATSSKKAGRDISLAGVDSLKGLRVALPEEYRNLRITGDEKIQERFRETVKVFEDAGAIIDYVSLPSLEYSLETYYIIMSSEVSTNLSRFDGVRFGYRTENYETLDELYTNSRTEAFGEETKRRIMLGTYSLSAGYQTENYKKALRVRTLIKQDYERAFRDHDVILSLTAPMLPFELDSMVNSPVDMYKADLYTVPVNLAGLCAISVPMGDVEGLPVGLQITGPRFGDSTILKAGLGYERVVR
ncbi:MAG: Asp-tRNA(Asn)/Glu-tRNA(Gln) amidotransferase subunit GatA [Gudongella sp.]|nr:Asp-tRNA(Asn)/Glu-tRNA(Gln) amidotransferase subunit GatA [Gudongella sp.]